MGKAMPLARPGVGALHVGLVINNKQWKTRWTDERNVTDNSAGGQGLVPLPHHGPFHYSTLNREPRFSLPAAPSPRPPLSHLISSSPDPLPP